MKEKNKVLIISKYDQLLNEHNKIVSILAKMGFCVKSYFLDLYNDQEESKHLIDDANFVIFLFDKIPADMRLGNYLDNDVINYASNNHDEVLIFIKDDNKQFSKTSSKNKQVIYWNEDVILENILIKLFNKKISMDKNIYSSEKDDYYKQRTYKLLGKILAFSVVILAYLLSAFILLSKEFKYDFNQTFIFFLLISIMISVLGIFIYYYLSRLMISKRTSRYSYYLENRITDATFSVNNSSSISKTSKDSSIQVGSENLLITKRANDIDIILLMLKNTEETTEYFSISKDHVKSSFKLSKIACTIGIIILATSVILALVLPRIEPAIIAAVSGAITEVIAGTVFWVHNKSAMQLNHYYEALHENEKFLSAVSIADKICDEKRDEVLFEIIKKQLDMKSAVLTK